MRQLIFDTLRNTAAVTALVGTRIYEGGALTEVPKVKPFLVVRMGAENVALKGRGKPSEAFNLPKSQYSQLWAHDEGGDYLMIDNILFQARIALESIESVGNVLTIAWIEGSRDLRDPDFNTLTKYSRYLGTTSRSI